MILTIRARMEELRRERSPGPPTEEEPRGGRQPRGYDPAAERWGGADRGRRDDRGEGSRGWPRRERRRTAAPPGSRSGEARPPAPPAGIARNARRRRRPGARIAALRHRPWNRCRKPAWDGFANGAAGRPA